METVLDKDTELEELQNQIQEQASSLSLIHASKAVKPSRNSTTNSNDSSEKKLSFLETLMGCRVELDEEERFSCTLFNPANKRGPQRVWIFKIENEEMMSTKKMEEKKRHDCTWKNKVQKDKKENGAKKVTRVWLAYKTKTREWQNIPIFVIDSM